MIRLFNVHMSSQVSEMLKDTIHSGYIGQGPRVEEFEDRLLEAWSLPSRPLATSSCTHALDLAYHLCGVTRGSEVISTPTTCSATNIPLVNRGAKIVWADVDRVTGLISPDDVKKKITERTKAIVAVDWAGRPCDYRRLQSFGIPIIQDSAHRLGLTREHGDYVCFSSTTDVITKTGRKRISKITKKDLVLTSTGKFQRVIEIHRSKYSGKWTKIRAGQTSMATTANHPVLINRKGRDKWIRADQIKKESDSVYVATRECSRCKMNLIPFYGNVCELCFLDADVSLSKRKKLQAARQKRPKRETSSLAHHGRDVVPWMSRYEKNGYRVIPLIHAIPDFIALRGNEVIAVEVESGTSVRLSKSTKYDKLGRFGYDDVVWITKKKSREAKRYKYEIVGNLARVPVCSVKTGFWHSNSNKVKTKVVYNLTVANNPTFFARGILVHNCWSFQAIKFLTTGDGGALLVPTEQRDRAELLRWYGLDRKTKSEFRCDQNIKEAGYKYHMNDIAATIGLGNFDEAHENRQQNIENAKMYSESFSDLPITVPPPDDQCPFWIYSLITGNRSSLQEHLGDMGIESSQVHASCDRHDVMRWDEPLNGVFSFDLSQLAIPVGWWLTDPEKELIIASVRSYFGY